MAERKGDDFAPEEGWHLQENWAGIFTDRTGHMATHVSGTHGKGNPFWTRAASQLFFFKARLPLAQPAYTAFGWGNGAAWWPGILVCVVEKRTKIIECAPYYHVRAPTNQT